MGVGSEELGDGGAAWHRGRAPSAGTEGGGGGMLQAMPSSRRGGGTWLLVAGKTGVVGDNQGGHGPPHVSQVGLGLPASGRHSRPAALGHSSSWGCLSPGTGARRARSPRPRSQPACLPSGCPAQGPGPQGAVVSREGVCTGVGFGALRTRSQRRASGGRWAQGSALPPTLTAWQQHEPQPAVGPAKACAGHQRCPCQGGHHPACAPPPGAGGALTPSPPHLTLSWGLRDPPGPPASFLHLSLRDQGSCWTGRSKGGRLGGLGRGRGCGASPGS